MSDKKELFLVLIICFIGFIIWKIYYTSYEKNYTIGEVVRKATGLKSGTAIKFEFYYQGRKIEGGTGMGDYSVRVGDRYVIEFSKEKLDLSEALLYYPVPDTVEIKVPWEGWAEVPKELKQYRRKRMEIFGFYDLLFGD
ncbi:hypothetical protein DN752_01365 [Echinicola strongylocentroti]|uniref:DUF3592 domain-containing protein n=1 Tax=Echinicola strongylocentroti TaxID=1795355 RepID=A0A2Z4IE25_9BACT|nr:hypothetical protein [Echinicola strongylocentroti]AWW28886.1 hypothetical protein DN752_01365 [Echinicola strongylocentroti]